MEMPEKFAHMNFTQGEAPFIGVSLVWPPCPMCCSVSYNERDVTSPNAKDANSFEIVQL